MLRETTVCTRGLKVHDPTASWADPSDDNGRIDVCAGAVETMEDGEEGELAENLFCN